MRRKLHRVSRSNRVAKLSERLPLELGVHLDPGELARKQDQPDFQPVQPATKRGLQSGLRGDSRGERDREVDQHLLRDERGTGQIFQTALDQVQERRRWRGHGIPGWIQRDGWGRVEWTLGQGHLSLLSDSVQGKGHPLVEDHRRISMGDSNPVYRYIYREQRHLLFLLHQGEYNFWRKDLEQRIIECGAYRSFTSRAGVRRLRQQCSNSVGSMRSWHPGSHHILHQRDLHRLLGRYYSRG